MIKIKLNYNALVFSILILTMFVSFGYSANFNWTNGNGNSNWAENGNWDVANWPDDNGDKAFFNDTSTADCNTAGDLTIGDLKTLD